MRRRRGKTDTVDAEAAARAALCGAAAVKPKSADGCVEAIRMLSAAPRCAVKARTAAANQIDGLAVTAPEHLKDRLRGLPTARIVKACARLRPDQSPDTATAAAKTTLRALALRRRALTAETAQLDAELLRLCEQANPALPAARGVGAEAASALLAAAGDNPQRMRSEASVAALCATSPIEASSGRTVRHRLNRGGNRQANNALWRIATLRPRVDERSINYAARQRLRGQDPPRDRALPQAPHRTRDLQAAHRPAPSAPRRRPATPAHTTRARHPPDSPRPARRAHPNPRTRKRHQPQSRPRRTLPTTPRRKHDLTEHRSIHRWSSPSKSSSSSCPRRRRSVRHSKTQTSLPRPGRRSRLCGFNGLLRHAAKTRRRRWRLPRSLLALR